MKQRAHAIYCGRTVYRGTVNTRKFKQDSEKIAEIKRRLSEIEGEIFIEKNKLVTTLTDSPVIKNMTQRTPTSKTRGKTGQPDMDSTFSLREETNLNKTFEQLSLSDQSQTVASNIQTTIAQTADPSKIATDPDFNNFVSNILNQNKSLSTIGNPSSSAPSTAVAIEEGAVGGNIASGGAISKTRRANTPAPLHMIPEQIINSPMRAGATIYGNIPPQDMFFPRTFMTPNIQPTYSFPRASFEDERYALKRPRMTTPQKIGMNIPISAHPQTSGDGSFLQTQNIQIPAPTIVSSQENILEPNQPQYQATNFPTTQNLDSNQPQYQATAQNFSAAQDSGVNQSQNQTSAQNFSSAQDFDTSNLNFTSHSIPTSNSYAHTQFSQANAPNLNPNFFSQENFAQAPTQGQTQFHHFSPEQNVFENQQHFAPPHVPQMNIPLHQVHFLPQNDLNAPISVNEAQIPAPQNFQRNIFPQQQILHPIRNDYQNIFPNTQQMQQPQMNILHTGPPTHGPRDTFLRRLRLIPKFDGESYSQLREFIEVVDSLHISCINQYEEDELFQQILLQLRGESRNLVLSINNPTWETLKNRLLKHFKYLANKEILTSQLENIRQLKDESLSSYADRVRKLLKDKNSTYSYMTEEQKAEHNRLARRSFSRGITNLRLRDRLVTRGASSLEDAIAYAIEAENDDTNLISSNEMYCRTCNLTGHLQKDCRRRNSERSDMNRLISALQSISGQNSQSRFNNIPLWIRNDWARRGHFPPNENQPPVNFRRNFNNNWNNGQNRNWNSNGNGQRNRNWNPNPNFPSRNGNGNSNSDFQNRNWSSNNPNQNRNWTNNQFQPRNGNWNRNNNSSSDTSNSNTRNISNNQPNTRNFVSNRQNPNFSNQRRSEEPPRQNFISVPQTFPNNESSSSEGQATEN